MAGNYIRLRKWTHISTSCIWIKILFWFFSSNSWRFNQFLVLQSSFDRNMDASKNFLFRCFHRSSRILSEPSFWIINFYSPPWLPIFHILWLSLLLILESLVCLWKGHWESQFSEISLCHCVCGSVCGFPELHQEDGEFIAVAQLKIKIKRDIETILRAS